MDPNYDEHRPDLAVYHDDKYITYNDDYDELADNSDEWTCSCAFCDDDEQNEYDDYDPTLVARPLKDAELDAICTLLDYYHLVAPTYTPQERPGVRRKFAESLVSHISEKLGYTGTTATNGNDNEHFRSVISSSDADCTGVDFLDS